MNKDELRRQIDSVPLTDAHSHLCCPRVGEYAFSNPPSRSPSKLAALLTHYSLLLNFMNAGLTGEQTAGIRGGVYTPLQCRQVLLPYIPHVRRSLPFQYAMAGIRRLYGLPVRDIDEDTWDGIEERMRRTDTGGAKWLMDCLRSMNVNRVMLNLPASWGLSYYGRFQETRSDEEKALTDGYTISIATFDSYSFRPFDPLTDAYARLIGAGYSTFAEYDAFLEKMARFFVEERGVRGFKISEGYYRALNYRPVSAGEARANFGDKLSNSRFAVLSDYITWKVFEMARHYKIPVQIHTGELWGGAETVKINPMNLQTAIGSFPDLQFDLLHGGYPYLGETGILACNSPNVYVNMSYMFLRSLMQSRLWLDTYLNVLSSRRILLGSDVFDAEVLWGVAGGIRGVVCDVLAERLDAGLMDGREALSLAADLMTNNALELYGP